MVLKRPHPLSSESELADTKELILPLLYNYIIEHTDLNKFLDITLSVDNEDKDDSITIKTAHTNSFHFITPPYISDISDITIICKNTCLHILDQHLNILFEKELAEITNNNFFTAMIKPLKDIIISRDDLRKESFEQIWQEELYRYLLYFTSVEKKYFNDVKIEVLPPKDLCEFLNKTLHSKRPDMNLHFLLDGKGIITSIKIREHYDNYERDINEGYKLYKHVKQVSLDKIELGSFVDVSKPANKIKRI